jgi:hypothetical protein
LRATLRGRDGGSEEMYDELASLLDRTQVIETINRLFIGTDNRDWELVKGGRIHVWKVVWP